MTKALLAALLAISLTGCSLFTKTEYVDRIVYVNKTVVHPEPPNDVQMLDVNFRIISRLEFVKLLETLTANLSLTPEQALVLEKELSKFVFKDDEAMWILNSAGYSNLAQNVQELRRYILQQKNIIIYYRTTVPAEPKNPKTETD